MRRLVLFAALIALVATACRIETNIGAVINADGSGTVIVELGLDEEAESFFLQDGTDPFEDNDLSDLPGARTREERRGGLRYFIIEADVDSVQEIQDTILGNESSLLSDFTITTSPTLVTVSGTADAEESLGGETEGFDPGLLEDSLSATVFFTMPGSILEHNADRQDGNTLFWEIPILGGTLDIQASSDPTGTPAPSGGGDGGGIPVWVIVVIAAAVVGAVLYFMNQRKQDAAAAAPIDGMPQAEAEEGDEETPPPPPPTE